MHNNYQKVKPRPAQDRRGSPLSHKRALRAKHPDTAPEPLGIRRINVPAPRAPAEYS